MKLAKIASLAAIIPVVVGGIWWTVALAADVNNNSIHTLEANIDRWTYLKLQYEANNPAPRPPAIQAQIVKWDQKIKLAMSEIESRQEKD